MLKTGRDDVGSARKAPVDSQKAYHLGSTLECSNPFASSRMPIMVSAAGDTTHTGKDGLLRRK